MKSSKLTTDYIKKVAARREPDFREMLRVLKREKTGRPVLFEIFMNGELYDDFTSPLGEGDFTDRTLQMSRAFRALGYDYVSLFTLPGFSFPRHDHESKDSFSQNDSTMFTNREEFEAYPWPRLERVDFSPLDRLNREIHPAMKALPLGPGGVLENTTELLGFDNMCYLYYDDPEFLGDVFDRVGKLIVEYYKLVAQYDCIGALIANDDWGFASQTMLPPEGMRKYVIPWHKRIAQVAHDAGMPCVMHSCGNLELVMDDVIDVIGHDGKHSWEDKIIPVEEAWDKWGERIAIFGGIDMDFLCRATPDEVYNRARALIEKTGNRSYALGTGNSVPPYVPRENYLAMVLAGLE